MNLTMTAILVLLLSFNTLAEELPLELQAPETASVKKMSVPSETLMKLMEERRVALDADPERLEQVLARQAELKKLTRKYAADADGVLAWAKDARQRLSTMDTSEEALAELVSHASPVVSRGLSERVASDGRMRTVCAVKLRPRHSAPHDPTCWCRCCCSNPRCRPESFCSP